MMESKNLTKDDLKEESQERYLNRNKINFESNGLNGNEEDIDKF